VKRFLQIDHDLGSVGKRQSDHSSGPLVINIGIRGLIDVIAATLYRKQKLLRKIHEFKISTPEAQKRATLPETLNPASSEPREKTK